MYGIREPPAVMHASFSVCFLNARLDQRTATPDEENCIQGWKIIGAIIPCFSLLLVKGESGLVVPPDLIG